MNQAENFIWPMARELVEAFFNEEYLGRRAREYIDKNFSDLSGEEKDDLLFFSEEYFFIKRVIAKKYFDIWLVSKNNSKIIEYFSQILPVSENREGIIRDIVNSCFVSDIIKNELQKIIIPHITEADVSNYSLAPSRSDKTEALFQTSKRICNQNNLGKIGTPAFKEIMHFVYKQISINDTKEKTPAELSQVPKNILSILWGKLRSFKK